MSERPEILILNGPNLNMLGTREPELYGAETLDDVDAMCADHAATLGLATDFRQSNFEGEMVTIIQQARGSASGIIINAGAYTHTSVAIHDALRVADLPVIEVHVSNIHRREPFRHTSYISSVAEGIIVGLGTQGYVLALDGMARILDRT
ncbi:type II 3-dehydroquinate dehydratase [Nisaea nitritireducens]|nr:type II 3-dehydroquinate dehydratase [Nisaea nitritireducens]